MSERDDWRCFYGIPQLAPPKKRWPTCIMPRFVSVWVANLNSGPGEDFLTLAGLNAFDLGPLIDRQEPLKPEERMMERPLRNGRGMRRLMARVYEGKRFMAAFF